MTIVFRYTVSDLVLRTEVVTTGRHGPRERQATVSAFELDNAARATLTALGIDVTHHHHGRPKHVDLVTFRAVPLPNGTRIEKRLIVVDTHRAEPQQIEQAIAQMAESKRRAQDITTRNTRIIAARARSLQRFALAR